MSDEFTCRERGVVGCGEGCFLVVLLVFVVSYVRLVLYSKSPNVIKSANVTTRSQKVLLCISPKSKLFRDRVA